MVRGMVLDEALGCEVDYGGDMPRELPREQDKTDRSKACPQQPPPTSPGE